jgi:hypothetical protein
MFRLYDMNNFTNSPPPTVQTPLPMRRGLLLSNSPMMLSNSPTLSFFQKPMIANVAQAKGGCGSCGGTR